MRIAMNKQCRATMNRIKPLVDKWEGLLQLRWITVEHVYIASENDEVHSTIADTDADWKYQRATVRWYLIACAALDDDELEKAVVHEYVHCMISPIENRIPSKYEDLSEFTVESLARSLISCAKTPIA